MNLDQAAIDMLYAQIATHHPASLMTPTAVNGPEPAPVVDKGDMPGVEERPDHNPRPPREPRKKRTILFGGKKI